MMQDKILEKISHACVGLVYISETDAPITPFLIEPTTEEKIEKAISGLSLKKEEQIEEISFDNFFERLTAEKDWHGAKELEIVAKFRVLRRILEENLTELKVFKIGRVRKDIFVAGRDKDNRIVGVRTESVET